MSSENVCNACENNRKLMLSIFFERAPEYLCNDLKWKKPEILVDLLEGSIIRANL